LIQLVRNIGLFRLMRTSQLIALLAVYFESRAISSLYDSEANTAAVVALVVLLMLSELLRVGRLVSIKPLVWIAHIARITGLGWAGTGFVAVIGVYVSTDWLDSGGAWTLFWIAGAIAFLVSLYMFSIGRTRIRVRQYRIGDTESKPDLRISALSDLHLGEYVSAEHIRQAVEISNRLTPDIVLLLGDYVDRDGSLAAELLDELTHLKANIGVYAVLGNHDVAASNSQLVIDAFESDANISLLKNTSTGISIDTPNGARNLELLGIESPDEWWQIEHNDAIELTIQKAIKESESDFRIVASHHPDVVELCAQYDIDLVVAGHTHGGQLAVPFGGPFLNAGRLAVKYLWKQYEINNTKLIVTPGVGVGILPARIGVPPEVTLIELSFD
jgi:uncharacterized protein